MKAFDKHDFEAYKAEARERWGGTEAYREHAEKTKNYGKEKWNSLAADMDAIFAAFARCMQTGDAPGAEEVQSLVRKLQEHISENCYICTGEILTGLGQMYVADERFRTNIDRYGEGTAAFISAAIARYCGNA